MKFLSASLLVVNLFLFIPMAQANYAPNFSIFIDETTIAEAYQRANASYFPEHNARILYLVQEIASSKFKITAITEEMEARKNPTAFSQAIQRAYLMVTDLTFISRHNEWQKKIIYKNYLRNFSDEQLAQESYNQTKYYEILANQLYLQTNPVN